MCTSGLNFRSTHRRVEQGVITSVTQSEQNSTYSSCVFPNLPAKDHAASAPRNSNSVGLG